MPWLHSSANKVQTNLLFNSPGHEIFEELNFGSGIFLGFAGSPRDIFGLDFSLHSIIPIT